MTRARTSAPRGAKGDLPGQLVLSGRPGHAGAATTAGPPSRRSRQPVAVPGRALRLVAHETPNRGRLVDQIEAAPGEDPGLGGWSGGFANQAHWDPTRPREWRCWAQSGPTWSAHCGAEVAANDTLGLCKRHRKSLFEEAPADGARAPEHVLNAG